MKYNELAKKAARNIVIFAAIPGVIAGVASVLVPMIGMELLEALVYMGCGLLAKALVEDANRWMA